MRTPSLAASLLVILTAAAAAHAQDTSKAKADKNKPAKVSEFWQSTTPFEATLTVNLKALRNEKVDQGPWLPATLSYGDSGSKVTLPVQVRARGHSRLKICNLFPPIWVNFAPADKGDKKQSVFDHVKKFKLVTPCKPPSQYESYVVEEYNLYRIHALMTPISHLTRLIHMTVVDSGSKKADFTRYTFAVEDADELSARLGGKKFAVQGATGEDLDAHQTAFVGLFEYMIGNTDWSIYALHNTELLQTDHGVYPIAYDFDQAGAINPPYAIPDSKLGIRSVTERLYRGFCVSPDTIAKVLTEFREKRPAITAFYSDSIGKLIQGGRARSAVKWFDDFYADMGDARTVKSDIVDKCRDVR
jgi:hypothetical protein